MCDEIGRGQRSTAFVTSVIWHATISLDGFLAGSGGDMDWMAAARGLPNPMGWDLVPRIGAIVAGRRTHDLGLARGADGAAYGGAWRGPIFVPTCRPQERSPHPDVVFVDGVAEAVRRARAAADGRDVALLGGAVASVAVGLGLVHELLLHVVPVCLGEGIRLWPRTERQEFEVLDTAGPGELPTLRLRPRPA
jgi:dihydrofolate reductase